MDDLVLKKRQKMQAKLKAGKAYHSSRLWLYLQLGWTGDSRTTQKLKREILKNEIAIAIYYIYQIAE